MNSTSKRLTTALLAFAFILIMLASWILNFGWLRFIGTFLLIPLFHPALFFVGNLLYAELPRKKSSCRLTVLSFATFLLPHLLIADGGDEGELYLFFHLIESNAVADVTSLIAEVALLAHVVILTVQYVAYFRHRKKEKLKQLSSERKI